VDRCVLRATADVCIAQVVARKATKSHVYQIVASATGQLLSDVHLPLYPPVFSPFDRAHLLGVINPRWVMAVPTAFGVASIRSGSGRDADAREISMDGAVCVRVPPNFSIRVAEASRLDVVP